MDEGAIVALWYTLKVGITARDYYQGLELKLDTQIKLQDEFPDFLLLPGIWPDFGVVAEPSAFGCEVIWEENQLSARKCGLWDR